jgi:signal transduction histidine kinase
VFFFSFEKNYYDRLKSEIDKKSLAIKNRPDFSGLTSVQNSNQFAISRNREFIVQVFSPGGKTEFYSSNILKETVLKNYSAGWKNFEFEYLNDRNEEQEIEIFGKYEILNDSTVLFVGVDLEDFSENLEFLYDSIILILCLGLFLGIGVGILMNYVINRKIDSINKTCLSISSGKLSHRIETDNSGDEFDRLISNINTMLFRQESLITGVRRVSDNIAHDIRTPLTKLFTGLEYLKRNYKDESLAIEIDSSLSEINHLLRVLQTILKISQLESGSQRTLFEKINLNALILDLVEYYEPLLETSSIRFQQEIEPNLILSGDKDLLFQAISNIIDNSIKFSPKNGSILIKAATENEGILLTVSDDGPGIPKEYRQKVFERFFRVEESRSKSGYGLGLSLVKTAIEIHSGKITINDTERGLTISVRLPKFKNS